MDGNDVGVTHRQFSNFLAAAGLLCFFVSLFIRLFQSEIDAYSENAFSVLEFFASAAYLPLPNGLTAMGVVSATQVDVLSDGLFVEAALFVLIQTMLTLATIYIARLSFARFGALRTLLVYAFLSLILLVNLETLLILIAFAA